MFEQSPDALLTEVEDCHRQESRLVARRLKAIAGLLWVRTSQAEGVDGDPGYALITGFARTSAEVGAAMNLTPAAASVMVGHAEALDIRLPRIAALLDEARIDWRTAQLVITRTSLVDHDLIHCVDAALAERITAWQCWSRKRIINAIDAAVRTADPKAAKERRVNADNERDASVTPLPNGMAEIRVRLSAPAGAVFDKRLDEMADSVCANDPRTRKQRRADAVEALANGVALRCTCGSPDCPARSPDETKPASRFVINVIATEETVENGSEEPGYLEGYGVIDADQIRELAKDAALRLLSEPLVSDGQAFSYHPSAAVERWVRCRDLTCCFPGCDRPAWRADIDHTIPFDHQRPQAGGLTDPSGLKCYCRQHHRLKTFLSGANGWRDEQLPDGTVVFTSPTGRVYRNTPAGADLFPRLGAACLTPKPRKRNHRKDKRSRAASRRTALEVLRPLNHANRTLNRARREEIDNRRWRNRMRMTLLVLKGGAPSTSQWCTWVNEPVEDDWITAEWTPPPAPPPSVECDEPPF